MDADRPEHRCGGRAVAHLDERGRDGGTARRDPLAEALVQPTRRIVAEVHPDRSKPSTQETPMNVRIDQGVVTDDLPGILGHRRTTIHIGAR